MQLIIPEQTEAIQKTLECLESIRLNESGRAFHVAVRGEPSPGMPGLFLSSSGVQLLDDSVGLLVLSARPRYLDAEKIALFGVREWTPAEFSAVDRKGIQVFDMKEIMFEGLPEVTDSVMALVRQWGRFHVVLDLSILEPVHVPGIRQKSHGGLSVRELLYVLQRLKKVKNLESLDCILDATPDEQTSLVCAKILAELL